MGISLELDRRYKVDKDVIREMGKLRKEGFSYQKIADKFGVSSNTVMYWLDKDYRKRQRKATSSRRYPNNKLRVVNHIKQDKLFRFDYALGYIAKQVNSWQYKKGDHLILGISMKKHWIPYLEREYKKGGRKLGI